MRIGITGASGLVGRTLTATAAAGGHQVIAYSRSPERMVPGAAEVRDISRPAEADFSGLDALVSLAGESVLGFWSEEKKRLIRDSRVAGTEAIVHGLFRLDEKERPRVFVSASGTGIYGDRGDEVLDEDTDPGFGFLASVSRDWESAARRAEDFGVRTVCGRLGLVMGRTGGALPLLRRIFRCYLGGRLGSGRQWMPWLHVEDAARMFLHAIEDETLSGPVNFVAPRAVTNAEFTRAFARWLNRPAPFPVPGWVLSRAPGGMRELFLFSERAEPAVLRASGFDWRFPDLETAFIEALGPNLAA
ncbi:MAG: TIGR01777 family oxidoreductase [Verrucomicrobiae bacterium]|nr:TIGR01777 family oxidoreductase [Verrucomicrobiae bacterium]